MPVSHKSPKRTLMTETAFQTPQGLLTLQRYPIRKSDTLRAWDAADELLISYLHDEQVLEQVMGKPDCRVLIFEDQFGALTTSICQAVNAVNKHVIIDVITDSLIAESAITQNLNSNDLQSECADVGFLDSISTPADKYDLVIYKLPRNLAYCGDVMTRLRNSMGADTKIIGAAMAKYLPLTALALLNETVGTTTTSRATKKARLIFSVFDENLSPKNVYPTSYCTDEVSGELISHSNIFSRESIDMGTRFLLPFIPQTDRVITIVDLACGNGVVGVVAAQKNSKAKIIFCDESKMAVESARESFESCCEGRDASFYQMDCLDDLEKQSVDMVLCNPPFHQQNTVSNHIAWQMFKQSMECLKSGGTLWVVGNRHLGYDVSIKKIFGNSIVMESNTKFMVVKATKR